MINPSVERPIEILSLQYKPVKIQYTFLVLIAVALMVMHCTINLLVTEAVFTIEKWPEVLAPSLFVDNMIAVLLAIGFSFIPYRGLPYRKKYIRTLLITIIAVLLTEIVFPVALTTIAWFSPLSVY